MPRSIRRLLLAATTALIVVLAPTPAAHAGDYTVRLTSTSGSHWHHYDRGPFLHAAQRLYSGIGTFGTGDFSAWRMVVPGDGTQVVGGRAVFAMSTPHAVMRGRVLAGTGTTQQVLYDQGVEGTVEQRLTGGPYGWVQLDLRSTGALQTSRTGEDFVNLQLLELVLRDAAPPTVAALALPPAGTWYRADACIPFRFELGDQGGGLDRVEVRRARDGLLVSQLAPTLQQSPRPGPTELQLNDCIQPGERAHGDTSFVATARDVGGNSRSFTFTVRADHQRPTISGGPSDGARFMVARPDVTFAVSDQETGIATTTASVDGRGVGITTVGSSRTLRLPALAPGRHVVVFNATDKAGNATRVERRLDVVDITPPRLLLESPGTSGSARAVVRVRASDDLSGIDPRLWRIAVDGDPVALVGDAATARAAIGPLGTGVRRITVSVSDRAGNAGTHSHVYRVIPPPLPPPPAAAAAVGPTGIQLVATPRDPVTFGSTGMVVVRMLRAGIPQPGRRVELWRGRVVVGNQNTDVTGHARIRFRVVRPGRLTVRAPGQRMAPQVVSLRVRPRLVLRALMRRPRIGARVTVSGRMVPPLPGRRVVVQARIGAGWFSIRRTARVDARGHFRTTVVPTARGRVRVRIRFPGAGAWSAAVSDQRLLDPRP